MTRERKYWLCLLPLFLVLFVVRVAGHAIAYVAGLVADAAEWVALEVECANRSVRLWAHRRLGHLPTPAKSPA